MEEESMNAKVLRAQDSQHFTWRPRASREFLLRQETKNKKIYFQRRNTTRLSSFVYIEWIGLSVL